MSTIGRMSSPWPWNPHIHIKNASKIYQTSQEKLVAVENISLDVSEGEFVALLGLVNAAVYTA